MYNLCCQRTCLLEITPTHPKEMMHNFAKTIMFYYLCEYFSVLGNQYITDIMLKIHNSISLRKFSSIPIETVFLFCFVAMKNRTGTLNNKRNSLAIAIFPCNLWSGEHDFKQDQCASEDLKTSRILIPITRHSRHRAGISERARAALADWIWFFPPAPFPHRDFLKAGNGGRECTLGSPSMTLSIMRK